MGTDDAFLVKLTFDTTPPVADAGNGSVIDQHQTAFFDGSNSTDDGEITNWTWMLNYQGEDKYLYGEQSAFMFDDAGIYNVTLTVQDEGGNEDQDTVNVTVKDITDPIAIAGQNITLYQHEIGELDGSKSSDNVGIVNWSWTVHYSGDIYTIHGMRQTFLFHLVGKYFVMLNVTDQMGNYDIDSVWVYVLDKTPPICDPGEDITIDQHQSVTLNGSGSTDNTGVINWTWRFMFKGSSVTLYGEIVEFIFDYAGTYEITLSVGDAEGNNASATLVVNVNDITPPSADAGPDQEVDQDNSVHFNATASKDNTRIVYYNWTFDYNGVDIGLKGIYPSYFFEVPRTYIITLTVTDLAGNMDNDTMEVKVLDSEPPVADAGDNIVVNQGEEVDLSATGSEDNVGIVSWTWLFVLIGFEETLEGETATFVFDEAGDYLVRLVVEDARGNSDMATMVVTVEPMPPPPNGDRDP
ncbi:MAG: PKD domain-containing protein, partial [Thermoplasmata archaeon]|nr:PKD domain-containing protein [Thermoplasmata archaeon]